MRKLLLSGLMVSVMAMPALAGLNFPDIDVKGDLSFKSITDTDYDSNKNADDKTDNVQLTANLKLSGELTDNVGLNAVLRNESTQGAAISNDNLNTVLSQTKVHQVYLNVKDIAGVDAVIGRQNIGEKKNALVYQASKADAIKLSKKCGPVDVTYVSANGPVNHDDISAIMVGGKIGPVNAALANYTKLDSTHVDSANNVLDIAVSGKIPVACGIDASLEYAMQSGGKAGSGEEKDATAMLVKLGCGGCDMAVGKVSCGLTILNTSGNATSADNKVYTGINPSLKLTEIASDIAAGSKNDDMAYNTAIGNLNAIVLNLGLAPAAVSGLNLGFAY
ncbi:hypothetical protein HY793_01330, partial [Candidatus Desantisbacteria bacterium]|nr:hypothetical protein [Candidatus Desantisbacteria bacterium]